MIWLLLLAAVLLIAAAPFLREHLRKPMDAQARQTAPGALAQLPSGCTHYRWTGPHRGPVAVCVHGLTTPSFVWNGIAKGLGAMGYRVLTYDLYGRGYSDRPEGPQDRAFFLTQLEELLEDQQVGGDFTLIGYSMGGAIATAFAAAHPDRLRELILLAPAGFGRSANRLTQIIRQVPGFGDWLMHALYPALHIRSTRAERSLPSSVPGIVKLQQQELGYRGFIPAVLASLRGILNEDFTEELRGLHQKGVPALAIWGQEDAVIPPTSAGRLAERARSVRQEEVAGAGHGLPYTHTEEVLEIIALQHRRGLI
ncbi:alpha/beta fold hydrolase [Leisingera sp. McT4-56]|uniref:alpha/beta fold hydrolase n=1 Tax=Leisingera sp. McT4-56 TaxID=2881255 RepID=UPI001CF862C3|nr:alpha/beta hydrolase [Leisingera sp. McT4-56]MCB4457145.1 alpha/beta hydrolase [Leisingera sp. McT4-56]